MPSARSPFRHYLHVLVACLAIALGAGARPSGPPPWNSVTWASATASVLASATHSDSGVSLRSLRRTPAAGVAEHRGETSRAAASRYSEAARTPFDHTGLYLRHAALLC